MSDAKITVQQTGSPIRRDHSQRATLIGLGLNKIGRTRTLPDTATTRGMIAKVQHLVRVIEPPPGEPKLLSRKRFDALAAYTRDPATILIFEEIEWHATRDERVIAVLVHDRTDHDYGFIILGRDERLRFRAIAVDASYPTASKARERLLEALREEHAKPDADFHQGDAPGNPHALIPLPHELIPAACHEYLTEDGRIFSRLPPFHPYIAQTLITLER